MTEQLKEHVTDLEICVGRALHLVRQIKGDASLESPPGVVSHGTAEYSYGGAEIRAGVDRDPRNLLPPFAAKVELLFQRLRAQGLEPMLWEGFRTFQRAEKLAAKGTGIVKSMHCYGAAVDIVDEDDLWGGPRDLWEAIGREAEDLGLTVLYRNGRRVDLPHVQAVAVRDQAKFRLMNEEERIAFLKRQWSQEG